MDEHEPDSKDAAALVGGFSGPRVRVGISACLVGHHVRYDGRDKRADALVERLGPHVEFVPVCPEVEVGMSVPREPIELIRTGPGIRLLGVTSGVDHTDEMRAFAARRLSELAVCGYIFKSRSPSCGVDSTPVFDRDGQTEERGPGMFAAALMARFPDMPVSEDEPLCEPASLAHFVDRIRAHARLQTLFTQPLTAGRLVAFHTREKLLLMAHDQPAYRELGPLVARASELCQRADTRAELAATYRQRLTRALANPASPGGHVNAMQHAAGYFKKCLDDEARAALTRTITGYGAGALQRAAPLQLLRRHAVAHDVAYLLEQSYFLAHGVELVGGARS